MFNTEDMEVAAKAIFEESLVCYLAKTIRAFEKLANNKLGIKLYIVISPDTMGLLNSDCPCLLTEILSISKLFQPATLYANIYLHPHTSKDFAKFCIAHELGHLYQTLCRYQSDVEKGVTPKLEGLHMPFTVNQAEEKACNEFAVRLCSFHHSLNEREDTRCQFKLFPKELSQACKYDDIAGYIRQIPSFNVGIENPIFFVPTSMPDEFYSNC